MARQPHDPAKHVAPTYALDIYKALEAKSTSAVDQPYLIFSGSISEVYNALGFSKQHYSDIMSALVESGSIEYVRRGNVHGPTILHLYGEPSLDKLEDAVRISKGVSEKHKADLEYRIKALENSLGGLNVKDALLNHEKRLKELERG